MKTITKIAYECEVCGRKDDSSEIIERCEKNHKHYNAITPIYKEGCPYPKYIHVKFNDGHSMRYGAGI